MDTVPFSAFLLHCTVMGEITNTIPAMQIAIMIDENPFLVLSLDVLAYAESNRVFKGPNS